MDVRASRALVNFLAAGVRGYWSDSTLDAWTELFMGLADTRCAEAAVRSMVDTWRGPNAPSFGQFKEVYDGEVRRELEHRVGLPPARPPKMSALEYILSVVEKAEDGSRSAQIELEHWRKFLHGPMADALPGVEEAKRWLASDHP